MDIEDNKTTLAVAALVIVVVVGIGFLAYYGDFGTTGTDTLSEENSQPESSSTSGQVSINVLPNPNQSGEGGGE